jgi:hypothetical protein
MHDSIPSPTCFENPIAVKHGQAEFTWGAGANLVAEGRARAAYQAALRALDANENDVKSLLEFARS